VVTAIRDIEAGGLAWREAGAGTPPLILLHGLGGSRISWDDQLRALGDDRRCVAWDAPGYGAAAPLPGPLTFPALADAVARLADALGPDRPHLAGLSFGGQIAQHAALAHPGRFRSLTLLSTSPAFGLDGTPPAAWRAARLAPLDAGREPADFAEAVLRGVAGPHISDEALAGQRAAMERISAAGLRRAIDCLVGHDLRGQLGTIALPTLVLVGELDDETPRSYAEAIAAEIPGARLEVVAGAGHLLNAEAPDAVNALLRAHLTEADVA
jgi:pimeloyl-ACP methyl ester carboxylesterase